MHRAVLLARGPMIDTDAILLTDSGPAPVAEPAPAPVAPPVPEVPPAALAAARAAAGYAAYGGGRIMAPPPPPASAPAAAGLPGNLTGLVGRTVAAVERDLIIDTLHHCSATAPMPPPSWASRSGRCATS